MSREIMIYTLGNFSCRVKFTRQLKLPNTFKRLRSAINKPPPKPPLPKLDKYPVEYPQYVPIRKTPESNHP
jgi:hypothetical protein